MQVRIDITVSAQENADRYFEESKRARQKREGAEAIIPKLEKKVREQQKDVEQRRESRRLRELAKKEWYEKFRWFFTSNAMLAIGGHDAQQNEMLNSKHFDSNDLFFHADVFGASLVILKDGINASKEVKEEVAQFAACHSRAWEQGSTVNVYALRRDQVSKSKEKGSLATGSFLLEGEREWYKNTMLEMSAFISTKPGSEVKYVAIAPFLTCKALNPDKYLKITPGNAKKSDAGKRIVNAFSCDLDYAMQMLPAGQFNIKGNLG